VFSITMCAFGESHGAEQLGMRIRTDAIDMSLEYPIIDPDTFVSLYRLQVR